MRKDICAVVLLFVCILLSGCAQPEKPKPAVNVCFVVTGQPYSKNMTIAEYMSGPYGDANGFLLDGIRAQNYTVRVMGDYYNLSGCTIVLSQRFDDSQSTADAIRNFVCTGGKAFVLWPGGVDLLDEFGMKFDDTKGLPIFSVYSQHPAASGVSKAYIPGLQGFSGGNDIITRSGTASVAEKACGSGTVILSASSAFSNNDISKFDNAKLALQIIKYLANDSSSLAVPQFHEPADGAKLFFDSFGSVGDALKTISQEQDAEGKTILAWWDYGTTAESYGMDAIADSASPSALVTLATYSEVPASLQQQVASALGYNFSSDEAVGDLATIHATANETEALDVIRRNNASYVLFSSDLESKFGALAYLYCYFRNETSTESIGMSECENQLRAETVLVEKNPKSESECNVPGKVVFDAVSIHDVISIRKYCIELGTLITLYDRNGTKIDTIDVRPSGTSSKDYYAFDVYYPSDSPDRKGKYYDTIFYRGLYDTLPASMNATLVYNKTMDGMLTKVYRIG